MTPLERVILGRRSCRRMRNRPAIPREDLIRLVRAGCHAPSGYNSQNYRFIVIDDPAEIARLSAIKQPTALSSLAAAWIAVVSDDSAHLDVKPHEYHIWSKLWTQNCAAAIQNILLLATHMGYASCWLSHVREMDGTRLLSGLTWRELFADYALPPMASPHGIVLLGWPQDVSGGFPKGDATHGRRPVARRAAETYILPRRT